MVCRFGIVLMTLRRRRDEGWTKKENEEHVGMLLKLISLIVLYKERNLELYGYIYYRYIKYIL